ncbi:phage major capsid protein [Aeromicrobium sp. Root472D3]|uniref:phage major capsid protein n=1 Tax=Aeromicrobium sp. Root472D3 TaxID=1736540 RepID=UPI0009E7A2B7|nr:phage major capsid protein [Aeromicrobium sp. Root472D3]
MVTDLSVENGWIPIQQGTEVLSRDVEVSAVEAVARREVMTSEFKSVPRFLANGVDVVAEHATIPLKDATLDDVTLQAHKFSNRYAISIEDREDAVADSINAYKREWLSNFAVTLDNAVLGVTGTGGPFESVYRKVGSGNRLATAGVLTYEDLVQVIGDMESNRKGGLVIIAHPKFKMALRNLKDSNGDRVVTDPFGAGVPTVFGHEVRFSHGARTSATYTDDPQGNPLLVVANKSNLILGVRSGPESALSEEPQWANDNVELKVRARRGFVLADSNSARVVELTPAA